MISEKLELDGCEDICGDIEILTESELKIDQLITFTSVSAPLTN